MTTAILTTTSESVPFNEIGIGKPFFYRGRFWVRTSRTVGTDIAEDRGSNGACAFFVTEDMLCEVGEETGWIDVEKVEITYR